MIEFKYDMQGSKSVGKYPNLQYNFFFFGFISPQIVGEEIGRIH